ncbi:GNAT family N-acetyltransferase [Streptacidiphilus sp. EB129]|uniref:GNAT family N-acetyltransferase n=1 Tax=Streptacidiphilus sp. EB129 TaxID=3156262 RepID=UPI0035119826
MTTEPEVTISDVPGAHRFEAKMDGELVGFVSYVRDDKVVDYQHTVVGPAYEGLGIGGKLARAVLDDALRRGLEVIPSCPFLKAWITRHPDWDEESGGA